LIFAALRHFRHSYASAIAFDCFRHCRRHYAPPPADSHTPPPAIFAISPAPPFLIFIRWQLGFADAFGYALMRAAARSAMRTPFAGSA